MRELRAGLFVRHVLSFSAKHTSSAVAKVGILGGWKFGSFIVPPGFRMDRILAHDGVQTESIAASLLIQVAMERHREARKRDGTRLRWCPARIPHTYMLLRWRACRREALNWEYGKPLTGVALGEDRLFSGQDADWDKRWNPSQPHATATLWRYMSFAKFCSLLEREALFFSLVGKMADRYEGFVYPPEPRTDGDRLRNAEIKARALLEKIARTALVSCWTESEHESSLMWETYAGREGVAVRTNFENLQASIRSVAELPVTFGQVDYVDYRERAVPRLNWGPLFHKRMEYRGEGEVRAVLPGPPLKDWGVQTDPQGPEIRLDPDVAKQGGRYVRVNLDELMDEVRVPPHAAPWFADAVRSVIEGSSISVPVTRSSIELPPTGVTTEMSENAEMREPN